MTDTLADFLDPNRNVRAAIARQRHALAMLEEQHQTLEALEQLEKAHYRIERAQRELAERLQAAGHSWEEIAAPLGLSARETRRRFASAWLGRGGGS
jgi:transcriptional regulator GlxA family with amidase domain